MTLVSERARSEAGWLAAARTAAALASGVGVGRFVFTPILPLMEAQAGLTRAGASVLATGNYFGYLVGAILGIAVPRIGRSRAALRLSAVVLVVSLAIVPLVHDMAIWTAERGIAGVASAVIFVVASNAILPEQSIYNLMTRDLDDAQRAVTLKLDDGTLKRLDDIFPGYRPAPENYAW